MKIVDIDKLKENTSANFGRTYQQCSMSVLDTIADPYITFNEEGICNYYEKYKKAVEQFNIDSDTKEADLSKLIEKIKKDGAAKKYDCISGVSGGVDSTYTVYLMYKLGLRPLIVHFDNGWNSELAVKNIENIIEKTGFDLYTLVVDWDEFKDLQRSYFKASVVDIEVPTDHAIRGTLSKLALKYNIKYIISGDNVVTENVLPPYWIFNKSDHTNIKSIHKRYGTLPLKTFPFYDYKLKKLEKINNVEIIALLNYFNYNKAEAKEIIKNEMNWKDYGGKHYESIFTKFYQAYILPRKFNIDKRKAHLSNLIFSGQISKEEALLELKMPLYNEKDLIADYEFVIKKLNFSEAEFEDILNQPRPHPPP